MSDSRVEKVLVTGAGGFIGHFLVSYLKERGYWVKGVDIKKPEYEPSRADEFLLLDLRNGENALRATEGMDHVYALASDMGGMGFISANHYQILMNNLRITSNTIDSAYKNGASRVFYSSSACVYPEYRQEETDIPGLREVDAYPAAPQDAYGWEKLLGELIGRYLGMEKGAPEIRIARFHNIYGPLGTWQGGREKAPAAAARKIALAKLTGDHQVEIWGDGQATRSFCFIDDCLEGVYRLMMSDVKEPLNVGSDRMVSVDELYDIVAEIAGIKIVKKHVAGPQGVRGRNSDNTLIKKKLGWAPSISLEDGLRKTYQWIEQQVIDGKYQTA